MHCAGQVGACVGALVGEVGALVGSFVAATPGVGAGVGAGVIGKPQQSVGVQYLLVNVEHSVFTVAG